MSSKDHTAFRVVSNNCCPGQGPLWPEDASQTCMAQPRLTQRLSLSSPLYPATAIYTPKRALPLPAQSLNLVPFLKLPLPLLFSSSMTSGSNSNSCLPLGISFPLFFKAPFQSLPFTFVLMCTGLQVDLGKDGRTWNSF